MATNTLGIIGKGHLVANFFDYLVNSYGEKNTQIFFEGVHRILFLNHGYETTHFFKQSKGYQRLESTLSAINGINKNISLDVVDSFKSLVINSDVVLDAAGGYISRHDQKGGENLYSLFRFGHAKSVAQNGETPSLIDDYKVYSNRFLDTERVDKGRVVMTRNEFEEQWNLSLHIIEAVAKVDELLRTDLSTGIVENSSRSAIGFRMYTEFPFTASMMRERGQQMQRIISSGYADLPTYLIVVNEPCMAANLFTAQCPSIALRTVACTGFDRERLEHVLNDEYALLKEQKGYKDYTLMVSLGGFHDTEMMIPLILPQQGDSEKVLAKIFDGLNYDLAYEFLKRETGAYYINPNHDTKLSDEQVSRHLVRTISSALQSRGKTLSIYPSLIERSLSNGYYHDVVEGDRGMFLVGDHRFMNGRVKIYG